MFKCGLCGKDSEPREKPIMVVLELRPKIYPARDEAGDPGGQGLEIARATLAHRECASGYIKG